MFDNIKLIYLTQSDFILHQLSSAFIYRLLPYLHNHDPDRNISDNMIG